MQKPKVVEKSGTAKDVAAILKQKYKAEHAKRRDFERKQDTNPQEKQPRQKKDQNAANPVSYAVEQSEDGTESGVSQGFSSSARMVDNAYHIGEKHIRRGKAPAPNTAPAEAGAVSHSGEPARGTAEPPPTEPAADLQPQKRLQIERAKSYHSEQKERFVAELKGNARRRTLAQNAESAGAGISTNTDASQPTKLTKRELQRQRIKNVRNRPQAVRNAANSPYKPRLNTVKTANMVQAQAAKSARRNVQKEAAKKAAVTTQKVAKQAVLITKKTVKIAIKAAAAFIRTIAAVLGVSVPLVIAVVVIGVAAALLASPLGMFFSDQDTNPDTVRIAQVVQETTAEFYAEIESIKQAHTYVDSVVMHYSGCDGGIQIENWIDALAVFAVKTSMDNNGMDVVTIDQTRIDLIRAVFLDMNTITYYIQEIVHRAENEDDEDWTEYILHITVTSEDAGEQARDYGFTADQTAMLDELLKAEYSAYFVALITGTGAGAIGGDITVIAESIYIWPSTTSTYLTSYFGGRINPVTGSPDNHTGIDIAAGYGTAILAAADGTVITSSYNDGGYGNYVVIDHGNGNRTLYGHMSRRNVSIGETVTQGQVIGLVGSTGMSTGPHLHFETLVNGTRVDPLLYFRGY